MIGATDISVLTAVIFLFVLSRGQLILSCYQNVLDTFETWLWGKAERPGICIFQAFNGIRICQFQKAHTAAISLLLDYMDKKNGFYSCCRGRPDFLAPLNKAAVISLEVLLMSFRHMGFYGTVLTGMAVQPSVWCDLFWLKNISIVLLVSRTSTFCLMYSYGTEYCILSTEM